jgi:hypothetical protein
MNMKRGSVLCLCALAMSLACASFASAQQTVTLSLDIFYQDPDNPGTSAGAWQLMATASGEGLAGLTTSITGNSSTGAADLIFRANTGLTPAAEYFKTTFDAKTWFQDTDNNAATLNMLFGQVPVAAPGPQTLAYDVGGSATPNPDELRTTVDPSGASMANAVILAIGRFNAGAAPAFVAGSSAANVFTAIPGTPAQNPPAVGTVVAATVTTQTRTNNASLGGDADLNKAVNLNDLTILGTFFNQSNQLWQNGDFTGDHVVNLNDLTVLGTFFNQTRPAAAAASAVPEPASACLLGLAGLLGLRSLRRRSC